MGTHKHHGNRNKREGHFELARLMKKVKLNLRPTRSGSASFVECTITHDNERIRFAITPDGDDPKGYLLSKEEWDERKSRATGINGKRINIRTEEILAMTESFFRTTLDQGLPIDLVSLKGTLTGKTSEQESIGSFLGLVKRFMEEYRFHDKMGTKVAPKRNTMLTYRTLLVRLTDFEDWRSRHLLHRRPLTVSEFTAIKGKQTRDGEPTVISEFKTYLKEERRYNPNSLSKAHKCLAKVLRWIQEENYAGNRVLYTSTTSVKFDSKKEALKQDELEALMNLELKEGSVLWHVRNTFVLAAHTGLRYSDWHKIDPNAFARKFQKVISQKTGKPVPVMHMDAVRGILEHYIGKDWPAIVMPSTSGVFTKNAKMNRMLKDVCKRAGLGRLCDVEVGDGMVSKPLHELVSTHTARRTFATLMLLGKGYTPQLVAILTGHNDLAMLRPNGPYFKDDLERIADILGVVDLAST